MIERWSKASGFDHADAVRSYITPRDVERTIWPLRHMINAAVHSLELRSWTVLWEMVRSLASSRLAAFAQRQRP
ncbi:MAG: hypothetical protein EA388_00335 [Nitriliruptor sp.]|nr:MAG: hypothetical protein EA388_00335 [Nitriliruptor sp.]